MARLLWTVPLLGPLLGLVAACAETGGFPAGSGAAPSIPVEEAAASEHLVRCQGNGLVRYVGHPLIMPGEPIPAEGAYVGWEDLPAKTRVLGPGAMATMDYVADRLNVMVDGAGTIQRLYCG